MNFYVRTNYGIDTGLGHISRVSRLLYHLKKNHTCSIFVDKFDKRNLHLINYSPKGYIVNIARG